jgi:hypothetical protein
MTKDQFIIELTTELQMMTDSFEETLKALDDEELLEAYETDIERVRHLLTVRPSDNGSER